MRTRANEWVFYTALGVLGVVAAAAAQGRQPPPPRPPSNPVNRGLPPDVRAPRHGWGTGGPNVRSPEGPTTPTQPTRPTRPAKPKATRLAAIHELVASLERRTPIRVQHVLWSVGAARGAWGDLDGDRSPDHVTLERDKERAFLGVHIQRAGGWRVARAELTALAKSKALTAWILPDDGTGKPVIFVVAARAPYLYAVPTDGRGGLDVGRAASLRTLLPPRVGKDDRVPYEILRIVPAAGAGTTRIEGRLRDRDADGEEVERKWTIDVRDGKPSSRFGPLQPASGPAPEDPRGSERPTLWKDFDGDGQTDVLSASLEKAEAGRESVLVYGVGKDGATEPREIGRLPVDVLPRAAALPLRLGKSRLGDKGMVCIFFEPWRVGIYFEVPDPD